MDVAFVETGMKTGVSVDGVIPRARGCSVESPSRSQSSHAAPQIPKTGAVAPLSRTGFER